MIKIDCCDYDSMGNYGRFPKPSGKNKVSNRKVLILALLSPLMSIKSIFDHPAHNIHNIK